MKFKKIWIGAAAVVAVCGVILYLYERHAHSPAYLEKGAALGSLDQALFSIGRMEHDAIAALGRALRILLYNAGVIAALALLVLASRGMKTRRRRNQAIAISFACLLLQFWLWDLASGIARAFSTHSGPGTELPIILSLLAWTAWVLIILIKPRGPRT